MNKDALRKRLRKLDRDYHFRSRRFWALPSAKERKLADIDSERQRIRNLLKNYDRPVASSHPG